MNGLVLFKGNWVSPDNSGEISVELPHYNYINDTFFNTNLIFTPFSGESVNFPLQGYIKEGKYVMASKPETITQALLLYLEYNSNTGEVDGYYVSILPIVQGRISLQCTITCQGCLEDQPNQLAHASFGGCCQNF